MAWLDALQPRSTARYKRPAAQHHATEQRPTIQPLQQVGLMTAAEVGSAVKSGTEKRGGTWTRIKKRVEKVEKGMEALGKIKLPFRGKKDNVLPG